MAADSTATANAQLEAVVATLQGKRILTQEPLELDNAVRRLKNILTDGSNYHKMEVLEAIQGKMSDIPLDLIPEVLLALSEVPENYARVEVIHGPPKKLSELRPDERFDVDRELLRKRCIVDTRMVIDELIHCERCHPVDAAKVAGLLEVLSFLAERKILNLPREEWIITDLSSWLREHLGSENERLSSAARRAVQLIGDPGETALEESLAIPHGPCGRTNSIRCGCDLLLEAYRAWQTARASGNSQSGILRDRFLRLEKRFLLRLVAMRIGASIDDLECLIDLLIEIDSPQIAQVEETVREMIQESQGSWPDRIRKGLKLYHRMACPEFQREGRVSFERYSIRACPFAEPAAKRLLEIAKTAPDYLAKMAILPLGAMRLDPEHVVPILWVWQYDPKGIWRRQGAQIALGYYAALGVEIQVKQSA